MAFSSTLLSFPVRGAPLPSPEPATSPKKPQAWEQLQYGMFIHFGMSTFSGVELDTGQSPSALYAPTNLDVKQWVKVAKDAGMTYAVLTAKHVSGHCLWDSAYTDYDVATSGNTADVVAQFMAACKEQGIKPGLYYCLFDTHHQGGNVLQTLNEPVESPNHWSKATISDEYFQFAKKQLVELHTRYPGVFEQWIDIPLKLNEAQRRDLYRSIKAVSPDCLIIMNQAFNDGTNLDLRYWPTDLINGEVTVPPARHQPWREIDGKRFYLPMEVCDTLGKRWFWVEGDAPRSTTELVTLYQNSVGRGTNLLLDVPPDRTGRIPEASVKALMALKAALHNRPLTGGQIVKASNVFQGNLNYRAEFALDGDPNTRWATDDDQHTAWLEVDLGEERTFDRVTMEEAFPKRIQAFVLEARSGEEWKPVFRGTTVGTGFSAEFPPTKARFVRLRVLESTIGPTLYEFALWPPTSKP